MSINKHSILRISPKPTDVDRFNYIATTPPISRQQFFKIESVTFGYDWPNIRPGINDVFTFDVKTTTTLHSHSVSILNNLFYAQLNSNNVQFNSQVNSKDYNRTQNPPPGFLSVDQLMKAIAFTTAQTILGDYTTDGLATLNGGFSLTFSDIIDNTLQGISSGHNTIMLWTQSNGLFYTGQEYIKFYDSPLLRMLGFISPTQPIISPNTVRTLTSQQLVNTSGTGIGEVALFAFNKPIVVPEFLYIRSNTLTRENNIYPNDTNLLIQVPLGSLSHGKFNTVPCLNYAKIEPSHYSNVDISCSDDFGPITENNPFNALVISLKVFLDTRVDAVMV